jgi:hypothetical protein
MLVHHSILFGDDAQRGMLVPDPCEHLARMR